MATSHTLQHPRKIGAIEDGEIANHGSSDGGATWYPVKVDTSGGAAIGGTSKTILQAKIDINSSGDNEIIAADANNKIKIVFMEFIVNAENDIIYKRGTTALTGAMAYGGTNEPRGSVRNYWPFPLCTGVNENFTINLSTAASVAGLIQYYLEA